MTIRTIGLGSLGSVFAIELAKRACALKYPIRLELYDFDVVEERNVFAQNFDYADIDSTKVSAVARQLASYSSLVEVVPIAEKVTFDRIMSEAWGFDADADQTVVIDAVDSLPYRVEFTKACLALNTPLLHLCISPMGTGNASWTYNGTDTFPLSPNLITPDQIAMYSGKDDDPKLPPCELNGFRPLIWSTAFAGVAALFVFLGYDTSRYLEETLEDSGIDTDNLPPGIMPTFHTSNTGIELFSVHMKKG